MVKHMTTAKPDEFKVKDEYFRLMPILSVEDADLMKRSIKKDGVRIPIEVLPDMTIIDGHQRWSIVKFDPTAPQDIPYEVLDLKEEEDIIEYILIKNLERRHLTAWQKLRVSEDTITLLTQKGKERKLANLKRGEEVPDGDVSSTSGKTRERIAEKYGIPEETQKLGKFLKDQEDWDTISELDRNEITQKEAWDRVRKAQGKEEVKPLKKRLPRYVIDRTNGVTRFMAVAASIMKLLFETSQGKDAVELAVRFLDKKDADVADQGADKSWKPMPYKGWMCVHQVVGGCWRCYPELADGGHRKKTSAHKANQVHIPVDQKELSGFTVLPDKDYQACHKCHLFDHVNNNCEWEDGTEIPEGCKKLKHRR